MLDSASHETTIMKEYATPTAHHAKRKRGPEVTAPNLILHTEDREYPSPQELWPHSEEGTDPVCAPQTSKSSSSLPLSQRPVMEPSAGLDRFVSGGQLRAAPHPAEPLQ